MQEQEEILKKKNEPKKTSVAFFSKRIFEIGPFVIRGAIYQQIRNLLKLNCFQGLIFQKRMLCKSEKRIWRKRNRKKRKLNDLDFYFCSNFFRLLIIQREILIPEISLGHQFEYAPLPGGGGAYSKEGAYSKGVLIRAGRL